MIIAAFITGILAWLGQAALAIQAPDCSQTVSIRWSRTSDRLYLESSFNPNAITLGGGALMPPRGGGCTTLTSIVKSRTFNTTGNLGPLYFYDRNENEVVDTWTGDFFLNSSLYIQDNVRLDVLGPKYGGDVNTLFLRSDETKFITIRAHGGRVSFKGVSVQSLDRSGSGGPDTNFFDGRSFVTAISEVVVDSNLTCNGRALNTMGEARLDIHDSHFSYLGYYSAESYGISYKVRGLCSDLTNLEVMDEVSVWGDITESEIDHLYFGHYSFGHKGGNWSGNHVHDNEGYGFDPHDDSDGAIIKDNHVHNNGWHGIIASKRCDNLIIEGNIVHDNGKNGIMLHRSSDNCTVANNVAYRNGDAGAAIFESSNTIIHGNNFYDNYFGIRLSLGTSNCDVYNNTFDTSASTSHAYAVFMYRGSDEPGVEGSDGTLRNNRFSYNTIIGHREDMKILDTRDNSFQNNILKGDFTRFRNSTGILWKGNQLPSTEYEVKVEEITCFDPASVVPASSLEVVPLCQD